MSDSGLDPELRAALRQVARAPHLLVGSDYDGTLAPIVEDPSRAAPRLESIAALRTLSGLPNTTVAVVSGRALRDLAALSRLPHEIHLVGSHGSEFDVDFVRGLDPEVAAKRDALLEEVRVLTEGIPGVHLELKPAGIAVHVRRATPEDGERALAAVRSGPARAAGIQVTEGKAVVELSAVQTDKGEALDILRHQSGASAAVFVGDDVTDEKVFRRLAGPDVGVKVGAGESSAQYRVGDTEDVSVLLATLASERAAWLAGAEATPIEDHTLLGDGINVALLTPDGDITWMCHPEPDSPALFADLIGGQAAGVFSVAPARGGRPLDQQYVDDSLVVRTRWAGLEVVDYLDRSPFPNLDIDGNTAFGRSHVTRLIREITGRTTAHLHYAPRPEFGSVNAHLEPISDATGQPLGLRLVSSSEPVVLISPGVHWEVHTDGRHDTATAEVDPQDHPDGRVVLELRAGADDASPTPLTLDERRNRTLRRWKEWVDTLSLPGRYTDAVLRSALTLKALCHGRTGGPLAAATTSLPEAIGGVRNWDYRYTWIRDGALTVQALLWLGSSREAEAYLQWLVRVVDEQGATADHLHPLYSIHGSPLGPEAVIEQLPGYAGSRPVRVGNAAQGQVQLDMYGPVVDLVADLVEHRGGGPAAIHEHEWRLVRLIVSAVSRRWQEPDASIWELRDTPRQHVYSKVMCWVAVDRAIEIAQATGHSSEAWEPLRSAIAGDVAAHGWDSRRGAFVSAYDRHELDAAALFVGLSGLIDPNDSRFLSTVDAIEAELRDGPTVYAYRHEDGLPGQEGGMHLATAWLSEAYLQTGRIDDAVALLDDLTGLAGPTGLLPEQYDPRTERHLGNHPQAYSHVGLIRAALMIDQHLESIDLTDTSDPASAFPTGA